MSFPQFLKNCKMNVHSKVVNSVTSQCDPASSLTCDGESRLRECGSNADTSEWLCGVDLESVKYLQRHPGSKPGTVDYAKLNANESVTEHRPTVARQSASNAIAIMPNILEAVIVLQVFRPTAQVDTKKVPVVVDMEIEVLSCQTLMDVRVNICCASDLDKTLPTTEGHKSAYFLIGDTFYNDTRPGCVDHSKPIIDWALEPGRGVGPFHSKDMSSAQMLDLPFQMGYPYLYVHQGDCEHWIVFKDMRLLANRNIRHMEYPKLIPVARRNQVRCEMCRTNVACWTVRENMRLPVDPSFFCEQCYRNFNFDSQNRKIGSFQSQSYIDKSVLL